MRAPNLCTLESYYFHYDIRVFVFVLSSKMSIIMRANAVCYLILIARGFNFAKSLQLTENMTHEHRVFGRKKATRVQRIRKELCVCERKRERET